MKKLKKSLKSLLKKEKFLVDIFIFGSVLKSKYQPRDVDLIILFREKNYKKIEEIIYQIKKIGDKLKINLHSEPLIIDDIYNEKVYLSLLHEGYSIRNMKFISNMLNFKPYLLITYNLKDKKSSDKVRFSYALYGRKKGEGLLKTLSGKELGKGSILVPIDKESLIKEFFKQWNVKIKSERMITF